MYTKDKKSIAFTGHRPDKLYGYDINNEKYRMLRARLYLLLGNEISHFNVDTFITGGALGFDTIAFEVVEELKQHYNVSQQILAIPFESQASKWSQENVNKYNQMKTKALNVYVDREEGYAIKGFEPDVYHPAKMQKRNEWMVDKCDKLLACWDGVKKGGTWNCVRYAQKLGKEIIVINPSTLEISYI